MTVVSSSLALWPSPRPRYRCCAERRASPRRARRHARGEILAKRRLGALRALCHLQRQHAFETAEPSATAAACRVAIRSTRATHVEEGHFVCSSNTIFTPTRVVLSHATITTSSWASASRITFSTRSLRSFRGTAGDLQPNPATSRLSPSPGTAAALDVEELFLLQIGHRAPVRAPRRPPRSAGWASRSRWPSALIKGCEKSRPASVRCAALFTRTFPSNTPRPAAWLTMHLCTWSGPALLVVQRHRGVQVQALPSPARLKHARFVDVRGPSCVIVRSCRPTAPPISAASTRSPPPASRASSVCGISALRLHHRVRHARVFPTRISHTPLSQ